MTITITTKAGPPVGKAESPPWDTPLQPENGVLKPAKAEAGVVGKKGPSKKTKAPKEKTLLQVKAAQGKGTITTATKIGKTGGPEKVEAQPVGDAMITSEPLANVGYSASLTIPGIMGPYSSYRAQVDVHLPCLANKEALEATYLEARDWVDGKMSEIVEEVKNTSDLAGD